MKVSGAEGAKSYLAEFITDNRSGYSFSRELKYLHVGRYLVLSHSVGLAWIKLASPATVLDLVFWNIFCFAPIEKK